MPMSLTEKYIFHLSQHVKHETLKQFGPSTNAKPYVSEFSMTACNKAKLKIILMYNNNSMYTSHSIL